MSLYFSLGVFLIIYALSESIVAAPQKNAGKGSSSGGKNCKSSCELGRLLPEMKNLGTKAGMPLFAFGNQIGALPTFQTRWDDVLLSEAGTEKGILKATVDKKLIMSYNFYPYSTVRNIKDITEVEPTYDFLQKDVKDATRDDSVVKFKLQGGKEHTLTFANYDNASAFIGQVSHHK